MFLKNTAVVVGLLAGCAGPITEASPPSSTLLRSAGREVFVALHTVSKSGPGWQSVMPGASLPSGTDFAVRVEVEQPVFLYLGQRAAGADLALLYPPQAPVRAEPSQPAQLPATGQWFRLDGHAGEEALFVLLSEKPQDRDTAKQLLGERSATACAKTRDPPPPDVKHRDRGPGIRGLMSSEGLTVLCFPFRHQ